MLSHCSHAALLRKSKFSFECLLLPPGCDGIRSLRVVSIISRIAFLAPGQLVNWLRVITWPGSETSIVMLYCAHKCYFQYQAFIARGPLMIVASKNTYPQYPSYETRLLRGLHHPVDLIHNNYLQAGESLHRIFCQSGVAARQPRALNFPSGSATTFSPKSWDWSGWRTARPHSQAVPSSFQGWRSAP